MNRRTKLFAAGILSVAAMLTLSGCDEASQQRSADSKLSSQAYSQQTKAQPYPASQLLDSLERANLKERLLRENKASAIRYVYLLGDTGTYVGYYTIKGKVSSNQSQMLPQDDVDWSTSNGSAVYDGPGDDGSYGEDAEGQFFFTTEGVMVSTDMRYIVSDAPLAVNAPKLNGTVGPTK